MPAFHDPMDAAMVRHAWQPEYGGLRVGNPYMLILSPSVGCVIACCEARSRTVVSGTANVSDHRKAPPRFTMRLVDSQNMLWTTTLSPPTLAWWIYRHATNSQCKPHYHLHHRECKPERHSDGRDEIRRRIKAIRHICPAVYDHPYLSSGTKGKVGNS